MAATSVWKIAGVTERVVAMWTVDPLSAGVIARTISAETGMPLSRSAVMGRISVLGLRRSALGAEASSATSPEKPGVLSTAGGGQAVAMSGFAPSQEVEKTDMAADIPPPAAAEGEAVEHAAIVEAKINVPSAGAWPIAALREGQCRFACTGHNVPADQHRFCGQPTKIGPGNLHGSWCPEHLEQMYDRSSRMAGPRFLSRIGSGR